MASNSLGLDFDQLKIEDGPELQPTADPEPQSPPDEPAEDDKKPLKQKPYVNPDRVSTGGPTRDKLTDEALAERMARMREQNEKIKLRRLDVQADEEAFKKTQEQERVKQTRNRRVQESIDQAREQSAKRKMDKVQSREWDSGKPPHHDTRQPRSEQVPPNTSTGAASGEPSSPTAASPSDQWVRGGSPTAFRGRGGRGRGRGRGRAHHNYREGPSLSEPTNRPPPVAEKSAT